MGAAHAAKARVPALAAGVNLMLAERTTAATQVIVSEFHLKEEANDTMSKACAPALAAGVNVMLAERTTAATQAC